jgi:hypothetical protein
VNDSYEKIRVWRAKAVEVRKLAESERNAFTRAHLSRVAETYDMIADEAEARMLKKIGYSARKAAQIARP